ncbi:PPE family protein [Mycobacterium szulgai]|uniref:PPE family protein n=1 Tax=Mycobacterium szulgai TaxID=1787 RepID=UPI000A1FBF34
MDYGALPPEINSARMYAGVGAAPLAAAAQAWDGLAAELGSAAELYATVVAELVTRQWVGPSAVSMAEAAASYLSWLNATAGLAAQTAGQLRSAVAAYEAAYVATVPPAEIELNRALLAALVATNVFGQNSAAIAATETQYGQMWAQDGAAMYSYAGASAAATTLTPFTAPPPGTNPAAALDVAPALLSRLSSAASSVSVSQLLMDLLASPPVHVFQSVVEGTLGLGTFSYGVNFLVSGVMLTAAPMIAVCFNPLATALSAPATAVTPAVAAPEVALASASPSASAGQAPSVGKLSVPPSWIAEAPEIRLAATACAIGLPVADAGSLMYGGMPPMGPITSVVNAPRGDRGRVRSGIPAKVVAGSADAPGNAAGPPDDLLSERDELDQLRKAASQLARQRDVLKRTAATLIQESKEK